MDDSYHSLVPGIMALRNALYKFKTYLLTYLGPPRDSAQQLRRQEPTLQPQHRGSRWPALLDVYQLAPLLAQEAQFVTMQITLLLQQCLRKQLHRHRDGQLHDLWNCYDTQEITQRKFVRAASRLYSPSAVWLPRWVDGSRWWWRIRSKLAHLQQTTSYLKMSRQQKTTVKYNYQIG